MLETIHRRTLLATLPALVFAPAAAARPTVEVWRQRGCACCEAWARHLEAAGFRVVLHGTDDMAPVRRTAGVPEALAGCHTAQVAGYVVEGHVPVDAIARLLAERPAVTGIAVPGMPVGSPGMEVPGTAPAPYAVIAFTRGGPTYLFQRVG